MTRVTLKLLFSIFFIASLVVVSCKKKASINTATCTSTISYASSIKTLMDQNCNTSGCHNSNSSAGGYNLTTYANVSAHASIILESMRHINGVKSMPQGSAMLGSSTIDQFDCWIQQGKMNN